MTTIRTKKLVRRVRKLMRYRRDPATQRTAAFDGAREIPPTDRDAGHQLAASAGSARSSPLAHVGLRASDSLAAMAGTRGLSTAGLWAPAVGERRGVSSRQTAVGVGRVWAPLGCGILGALLFLPAVSSGRIADDFQLEHTVQHMGGVLQPFVHNALGQGVGSGNFYRPLWVLWNALLYAISHGPTLVHVLNLVLFGLICAEVVLLVRHLADEATAVIAGLLFAVYPSHGESVAWITGNIALTAVALVLPALIVGSARSRSPAQLVGTFLLAGAAMLCSEIAALLPFLLAGMLWAMSFAPGVERSQRYWWPVAAMVLADVVVTAAHIAVLGGLGGYGPAVTIKRAVGSLASFGVGAFSAPQMPLTRSPEWLIIPVVLVIWLLVAWRRLARAGARRETRLVALGVGWFLISLLPLINEPLNLNTRTGDRELLMPSVGLILAVAVLVRELRSRAARACVAVLAILAAGCCVENAFQWRTAGRESRRLVSQLIHLAPRNAHLVMLSVPSDYRQAHLFPDAIQFAVLESGRPDVTVVGCAVVHALSLHPNQVQFTRMSSGEWQGQTTPRIPFSFPVLGSGAVDNPGCVATKTGQRIAGLGTASGAVVQPVGPQPPNSTFVYFDGLNIRVVRGRGGSGASS
jgi:hypothetical protein